MIPETLEERMSTISSTEFLEYTDNILGKEWLIYVGNDTLEILKENCFEIKSIISMSDMGFKVILNKDDEEYEGFGELVEEAIAEATGYEIFEIQEPIEEEEIIQIDLDDIDLDDTIIYNKEKSGPIEKNAEMMDIKIMDRKSTTLAYYDNKNCLHIRLTQKDIKKYLGVPYYNNIYEMIIDIINHEYMHHILSLEIGDEASFLYNEIYNSIEDKNEF